jgi:prepilin peptidase CpaA
MRRHPRLLRALRSGPNGVHPFVNQTVLLEDQVRWLFSTTILTVLLITAAISDVRARRVANRLNLAILIMGLLLSRPWPPALGAIGDCLGGVAVGMAIWFPMYLLRLVGAGDVKLIAASGAWLGIPGTLYASVATATVGGVLGLAWMLRRQGVGAAVMAVTQAIRAPSLLQLRPLDRRERVPYAVAIAGGVFLVWLRSGGLFKLPILD